MPFAFAFAMLLTLAVFLCGVIRNLRFCNDFRNYPLSFFNVMYKASCIFCIHVILRSGHYFHTLHRWNDEIGADISPRHANTKLSRMDYRNSQVVSV